MSAYFLDAICEYVLERNHGGNDIRLICNEDCFCTFDSIEVGCAISVFCGSRGPRSGKNFGLLSDVGSQRRCLLCDFPFAVELELEGYVLQLSTSQVQQLLTSATTMEQDNAASTAVSFATRLPRSLDTQLHVRLTSRAKSLMVSVATAGTDEGEGARSELGSFVYAIPNVKPIPPPSLLFVSVVPGQGREGKSDRSQRYQAGDPLCTTLYSDEKSLEFAVRLAKLIVRRTQMVAYVSTSISLERMGLGGTVEEILEAYQAVVTPLVGYLPKPPQPAAVQTNGHYSP